jgi:hypothetical protein
MVSFCEICVGAEIYLRQLEMDGGPPPLAGDFAPLYKLHPYAIRDTYYQIRSIPY